MTEYLVREGRWALWLVCGCYLVVVYITSRGLIAAPRYRHLQARIHDCRARTAVCAAGPAQGSAALQAVTDRLDRLDRNGQVVWRLLPRRWVVAIPLSKLAPAWRVLHEAESQLLRLEGPEEIAVRVRALRLRLASDHDPAHRALAAELAAHSGDPAAGRTLLIAVGEQLAREEDEAFEREYELQRIALWLALTGLGAVLLIGLVLDHRLSLLLGGLGGFLSPLIGVMRAQRPASWGVLVLAPVGGALAAPGGLLLVRMLADPELNLLGQVFLDNSWGAPARPISLAIALLFGFSGTLFSRLALAATGQLMPVAGRAAPRTGIPSQAQAPAPPGPGGQPVA
ncbi:hypothetical protein ACIPW5_16350 [Streptomyces sp. NPDC090077]|uniref:hypothetical protein n=1 Tax=Streptomyces sp. NPDC090077 TaxID=3365938 RepID=UPI0038226E91